MRRREFVGAMGALSLAAARPAARAGRTAMAWAWVSGDAARDIAGWRDAFARARAAGIRGVLVGDPGSASGGLATIVRAADDAGLSLHRWSWQLNRKDDEALKRAHPEWFTVSREGRSSLEHPPYVGYYQWVCPTRAEVRAYLAARAAEIAREAGVRGVHLDYIRHCDVILPRALWAKYGLVQDRELPPYDFCYCDACRAAFKARAGTDPLDLPDPAASEEWRRFRWDTVTAAVREIAAAVRGEGKQVTAAVFPTPRIARTLVRQAWDEWPLDAAFPMLYNRFYDEELPWIGASVREGVAALHGRPLHAGLYLPDLPPDDLHRAVRLALESGAAGVAVFNLADLSDAHAHALRDALG